MSGDGADRVAPQRPMSSDEARGTRAPLYTEAQRIRRDASVWTTVQAVLAPLQFLVFIVSLVLVLRFLWSGEGWGVATLSVLLKTFLLYTIMITGAIWEKEVFGQYLFAPGFFWEDVVSMGVIALQTLYVILLILDIGGPRGQMLVAVGAYAVYFVNAAQFLWKLRIARLEGAGTAAMAASMPSDTVAGGAR